MERPMHERRSHLRLIAAVLCLVISLLACSGPQMTRLSTAPAEQLRLNVSFEHLLTPAAQTIVDVTLVTAHNAQLVLADHQRLTVNGQAADQTLIRLGGAYRFTVPRSPNGGEYTVVYTDERGQNTQVVVPAPQRDLTLTAPAALTQLRIPAPGELLTLRYTAPDLFPPTSPPADHPTTQISAGAEGPCRAARRDGISATALSCIHVYSTQPDVSGSAVISDREGLPEYGFGNLAPGAGELYVRVDMYGYLPPSGFISVLLSDTEVTSIPITWI
jgi:hypothetical protein